MKIDGKNLYIFSDPKPEQYLTRRIVGHSFENEWLKIEPDGLITVKATEARPFKWDGCTPKWVWGDIVFGTPDGVIDPTTGRPKTQRASKFHDALNQFAPPEIGRKAIDGVFLDILTEDGFKQRKTYYRGVRIGGPFFMTKRKR